MNIANIFGWIGTGACDPNKDLKETLVVVAVVASWGVIIYLLTKLWRSKQKRVLKIAVSVLVILAAFLATFIVHAIALLALACSR